MATPNAREWHRRVARVAGQLSLDIEHGRTSKSRLVMAEAELRAVADEMAKVTQAYQGASPPVRAEERVT